MDIWPITERKAKGIMMDLLEQLTNEGYVVQIHDPVSFIACEDDDRSVVSFQTSDIAVAIQLFLVGLRERKQ
jgi:hypothetical protein